MTPETLQDQPLLAPILALCVWTLIMEIWMYATRLPAYQKYKVDMSNSKNVARELQKVPPHIFWSGENFNHLMEQPTQFYATALVLNALGARDLGVLMLAWIYVGLRIGHSLVQATVNQIDLRFKFFAASGVVLAGLTGVAVLRVVSA